MLQVSDQIPAWWSHAPEEGLLLSLDARSYGATAAAECSAALGDDGGGDPMLDPDHHCALADSAVKLAVAGHGSSIQPTPEVYMRLMSVYDAAGRPLKAADLALRLFLGAKPLASPLGGYAALRDLQEIACEAMCIMNEAGMLKVSSLIFEEALIWSNGTLEHEGLARMVS